MKERNNIDLFKIFRNCFNEWIKTMDIPSDKKIFENFDHKILWERICFVDEVFSKEIEKRLSSIFKQFDKKIKKQKKASEEKRRKIEELEQKNISQAPWELRGEIKAKERPKDSLLDKDILFDRKTIQSQMVPEEEETIDSLLKQRILENNFDDVIIEKKKKIETEVEVEEIVRKPFLDVYKEETENEQKRKKEILSKKKEKQHLEIKSLFRKICQGIDSFRRIDL